MEQPRRSAPRLSFSGRPAPRLETAAGNYEVIDLSPQGLRFRAPDQGPTRVTIGDVLRATIRFPADRAVQIEGQVLRVSGNEAALLLTSGHEGLALEARPAGPARPRRTGLLW